MRKLTISDPLPDLLFRRCKLSQEETLLLADEIAAQAAALFGGQDAPAGVGELVITIENLGAMIRDWEAAILKPSRGSMLTHALLQGAHAAEIESAKQRDNPYQGYDWRWAWMTGFDLGRRIDIRNAEIARLTTALRDAEQRAAGDELESLVRRLIDSNAIHRRKGTVLGKEDWDTLIEHLQEEVRELAEAIILKNDSAEILAELGDVLGIVVNATLKAGFTMAEVERREVWKLGERFAAPPPIAPAAQAEGE